MTAAKDLSDERFSWVAIQLHWTIAALIIANFAIAMRFDGLKGMALFDLVQWHKSLGITVLVLSLLRLAWRILHRPLPYTPGVAPWEKVAATAAHWMFYGLMIGLPLSGWILVSASPLGIPTLLYKTVPWPHIAPVHDLPMAERKSIATSVGAAHHWLAWGGGALLVLHVAAALRHHLVARDEVLWRMAPLRVFKPIPRRPPAEEP